MRRTGITWNCTWAAVALTLCSFGAAAQGVGRFDRTASCVAAMKAKATVFSERLRSGDDTVKSELTSLTEAGYAFIGKAYEAGLRKADADRLLASAEEAQKSMPDATLKALVSTCHTEGMALLAQANAAERAVVKGAARARVNRIRSQTTKP